MDAKLKRGTGIWVPDDAVIDRIAREELFSALGAASNALTAGRGEVKAGKEESVTGPTRDTRVQREAYWALAAIARMWVTPSLRKRVSRQRLMHF